MFPTHFPLTSYHSPGHLTAGPHSPHFPDVREGHGGHGVDITESASGCGWLTIWRPGRKTYGLVAATDTAWAPVASEDRRVNYAIWVTLPLHSSLSIII